MAIITNPRIPLVDPFRTVVNGGGETGSIGGWALCQSSGLTGKGLSVDTAQRYSGEYSLRIAPGSGGVAYCTRAMPVTPGQRYRVRVAHRSDATWTVGLYLRVQGRSTRPLSGFITEGLDSLDSRENLFEYLGDSGIAIANSWIVADFVYTALPNTYWANVAIYDWSSAPATANLWFELIEFSAINSFGEGLISETKGISATAIANTTLFTVPANGNLHVTRLTIKPTAVAGTITAPPIISVGNNSPNFDNVMSATSMINTIALGRIYNFPIVGSVATTPPFTALTARISTAAVGATTLNYDISVYGDIY